MHDVSRDGHAEAGALHLGRAVIVRTAERIKHDLLKFRRHTDAIVFDRELIAAELGKPIRFLPDGEDDVTAIRSVLDGVTHEVHEDLLDPQAVTTDSFMLDMIDMHLEAVMMLVDARLRHGDQVVHQLRQVEIFFRERHLSAFDACHIEDFVDEAQQMTARLRDFPKALDHLFLAFDIGACDGGQTDDGIHRCPDVVGHVGEEFCLRAARIFRSAVGFLQRLPRFDLRLFLRRHIHRYQQRLDQLFPLPLQWEEGRDFIGIFVQ